MLAHQKRLHNVLYKFFTYVFNRYLFLYSVLVLMYSVMCFCSFILFDFACVVFMFNVMCVIVMIIIKATYLLTSRNKWMK